MWSVKDHRDSNNSDIKSIDISSFTRLFLFVGIHFTRNSVAQLVLKCYMIFQNWSWFLVIDRFFFPHQNQIEDDQKSASKTSALYTSHVVNREKNHGSKSLAAPNFHAILYQSYRFLISIFLLDLKKQHQNCYLVRENSTLGYILS